MAKYLCVSAIWVEGGDADEAADAFTAALDPSLRGKGKVTVFSEPQTHQDGFLLDMEKLGLGEAVVPASPPTDPPSSSGD